MRLVERSVGGRRVLDGFFHANRKHDYVAALCATGKMTLNSRSLVGPNLAIYKSGQIFVGRALLSHLFTFFHIDIDSFGAKNCAKGRIIGLAKCPLLPAGVARKVVKLTYQGQSNTITNI
jgi:hypothetical protein